MPLVNDKVNSYCKFVRFTKGLFVKFTQFTFVRLEICCTTKFVEVTGQEKARLWFEMARLNQGFGGV